jgi:3-oxoacid CoA-transferase A subunit
MNKLVASADAAVADITDGSTVMIGGFGLCGNPENLIHALHRRGARRLTVISNNAGVDDQGIGILLAAGQIEKMIATYVGENSIFEAQARSGQLQTELVPQGTFAERIRAAGAGIPAFFTPAGVATVVAEGKETREFDGRTYLMERWLKADFALIKAYRGDRWGNLVYRKTARNFNPVMATAARITIAEVEHVVEPGEIDPETVVTPAIYVHRLLQGTDYRKPIERRTVRSGS